MALSRIEVQNGNDELTFEGGMVTIGGRTGADVVIRDAMIADRHCVITYDRSFVLRDTGSVTGTWVDGKRAAPTVDLVDGATIVIGTTKLSVAIGDDGGTATLQLKSDPQSFWWKKAGKGAFDNDPDQLVYAETKFGKFPALHLGNRVAMILGAVALIAATFASAVMEPLADPGKLIPSHHFITTVSADDPRVHEGFRKCVELSGEQGCNVCHTTGSGAPESKCVQCHGLEGEMGAKGSWRHPYHNDGIVGAAPGATDPEQFCVLCHTDHDPDGSFKPAAEKLLGDCAACHNDGSGNYSREKLIAAAKLELPPAQPRGYEPLAFPHDKHLAEGVEIDCEVCHSFDKDVVEAQTDGRGDNPFQRDFGTVAYAVCASCHVEGAANALVDVPAEQLAKWTPQEQNQWTVGWHGSKADGGQKCMQCHTSTESGSGNDGKKVFGPEMKMVDRGVYTAEAYQETRAQFSIVARSHADEFKQHSNGQACTKCHLDGKIAAQQAAPKSARTFWHALHVTEGSLAPLDPAAAASISNDEKAGCVSCHKTLGRSTANSLTSLSAGPYQWPDDADSRAACTECHKEGGVGTRLDPAQVTSNPAAEQRPDFPHGLHVGAASFGKSGTLEQGCFACHVFSKQTADAPFAQVPQTLADAANCTKCHGGHDDIAGGDCQKCHPKDDGFNSFVTQTGQTKPNFPTRQWPAPNGFSHLSKGHKGESCAKCHGDSLNNSSDLMSVTVPSEGAALCRECHLQKQFHWR